MNDAWSGVLRKQVHTMQPWVPSLQYKHALVMLGRRQLPGLRLPVLNPASACMHQTACLALQHLVARLPETMHGLCRSRARR